MKKIQEKYADQLYLVFRILVGFLFLQHGLQKMFGLLGGDAVEIFSLFGLAGIIELVAGFMIIFGLFTRVAALVGGIDMIGAWFIVHIKQGWIPIENNGELALLYLAAFIALFIYGSGKWSFDNKKQN